MSTPIVGASISAQQLRRNAVAFVTQAIAFHRLAMRLGGAGAALPLYYCALNLAKAELLVSGRTNVLTAKLTHGLSYNPRDAAQLRSDVVHVHRQGVFQELALLRLGVKLGITGSARVRLDAQLTRMSEVSAEADLLGLPSSGVAYGRLASVENGGRYHAVIELDDAQGWSPLSSRARPLVELRQALIAAFRPVTRYPGGYALETIGDWASERDSLAAVAAVLAPNGSVVNDTVFCLRPPLRVSDGAVSRMLPLPDHLARYMYVYLISSIVRYNPARVEFVRDAALRALVDLAVDEARTSLILDFAAFMGGAVVTR